MTDEFNDEMSIQEIFRTEGRARVSPDRQTIEVKVATITTMLRRVDREAVERCANICEAEGLAVGQYGNAGYRLRDAIRATIKE